MPMQNIIMLIVLGVSIVGSVVVAVLLSKNGKSWLKGVLAACLCATVGSVSYLSVAAATGTLMPPKLKTAFDPNMNGYYENIKADNGDVYTGNFVTGYYDGKGKIIYKDGSSYDGEWKAGKRNGVGTYVSTYGWSYTGEFADDLKNGQGVCTFPDKSVYDGAWQSDVPNGKGKITYKDTSYYDGDWANNLKQGKGTHTYFDEQGKFFGTYVGNFSADKRNGQGTFTYENGYVQSGEWRNDSFME